MNTNIGDALNRQVINKLDSFYLYLQIATWFDANRLGGFAKLMRSQAHEQVSHAQTIFNYQNEFGIQISLGQIVAKKYNFASVREVMTRVLEQGKFIASGINRMLDMAESAGEDNIQILLTWLASVQLHEEATMIDVIERVNALVNDGGDSLFDLDKELASRHYDTPAPLSLPADLQRVVG